METQTMRIPVAENVNLHVEVTGSGPAIVFIHGLTLDARMWNDQVRAFAPSHTVIAYDVRGFGRSDPPVRDFPYTHAGDILTILDYLHFDRAAIVGLSMGGWPAVDFALAYPDQTAALVLVDSTLSGYTFSPSYGGRLQSLFATWPTNPDAARAAWLADPLFAGSQDNPATVARLTEMVSACNAYQLTQPGPDPHRQPVIPIRDRLHEITAPTLVMVGQHDIDDFHDIARILHTGISRSRFIELPEAGHMANMDNPTLFNEILTTFLRSTDAQ